jgi:hypothetical protein
MTIPRLMSIRRLLISLLDIIEQELIERGAPIKRRDYQGSQHSRT